MIALLSLIIPIFLKVGLPSVANTFLKVMEARSKRLVDEKRLNVEERIAELRARVDAAREGTDRQKTKMSYPVFWFIIVAALGPAIMNMWLLTFYNWLWWENGVWPQAWSIAAYPPQSAHWVNMSIEWLFDPVGIGSTVASAAFAGKILGREK